MLPITMRVMLATAHVPATTWRPSPSVAQNPHHGGGCSTTLTWLPPWCHRPPPHRLQGNNV
eukprot:2655662-Prorocentrum_lima.AAC.1